MERLGIEKVAEVKQKRARDALLKKKRKQCPSFHRRTPANCVERLGNPVGGSHQFNANRNDSRENEAANISS